MTASSEDRDADVSARLSIPVLAMLLGILTKLGFSVNTWVMVLPLRELRVGQTLFVYATNLLIVAAIWILSRLKPSNPKIVAVSVLLGMIALAGFTGAAAISRVLAADNISWAAWTWQTKVIFGTNLFIGASAVWGFLRLRPWRLLQRPDEPVSPATRRTNRLLGLSGLVGILAVAALTLGTRGSDGNPVWSNDLNISPAFAMVAIAIWLVSMALSWWWYASADEHARRANDVGFLAGGGLFIAVTPAWWIASRAGLLPPPDAMILWYATAIAMGVGWWWYRNR